MGKLDFEVSKAIDGKFEVINTTSPLLHSRIGDVDFRRITLEQAEALVKSGTRYLKAAKTKKEKAAADAGAPE